MADGLRWLILAAWNGAILPSLADLTSYYLLVETGLTGFFHVVASGYLSMRSGARTCAHDPLVHVLSGNCSR